MSGRDVGKMGESLVDFWASQVGITANKSNVDRTGWDCYLEFPFDPLLTSRNLHRPAIECKLQVKATDKQDRKWQIKLSNLRRLATIPLPAFILVIEFGAFADPQSAFLVHIDHTLITSILKRIVELKKSNHDLKLHKHTMTITYNESNRIDTVGHSLKDAILKYTGDDLSAYISDKKSHLEQTGFESGKTKITFSSDNYSKLIDASLGLQSSARIKDFKAFDKRFEVTENEVFSSPEAEIVISELEPIGRGVLRLRKDQLSPVLSFPASLYSSPFNQFVPVKDRKNQIKGRFFDITINSELNIDFSYDFKQETFEIKEIRNSLRMCLMLWSGKNIHLEFESDKLPKFNFTLENNHNIDFQLSKELSAAETALTLIAKFDVSEPVYITLDQLTYHMAGIAQLNEILNGRSFIHELDGDYSMEASAGKEVALPSWFSISVGNYHLGIIFTLIGYIEKHKNGKYVIFSETMEVNKLLACEEKNPIIEADIRNEFESIKLNYLDRYTVVCAITS